jgi:hypothetical protein
MSSKTVKTRKNAVKIPEPEVNLVYKINLKNRMIHKDSLKTIDIQNEVLQKNIEKLEDIITLKKTEKQQNIKLPSEITNHFNNKPWIRIPYPIREIKLVEYTKDMTQEQKEKYLKLLYEKKLTSKVVVYNQTSGLIENITIELE